LESALSLFGKWKLRIEKPSQKSFVSRVQSSPAFGASFVNHARKSGVD
jgi:hypothetical protein